jgi:hypothetical protein
MLGISIVVSIVLVKIINKVINLPTKVDVALGVLFSVGISGFMAYSFIT